MEKYFDVLKRCALFQEIVREQLSGLLACLGARVVRYGKRETVLAEGSAAREVGIVLSGSVQIVRVDYYGNRSLVSVVEAAGLFAEAFACAGVQAIPVDVVAAEDCEIMLIDCNRILHACGNSCAFHQQLIYNLVKVVATKNILFHQKIEITSRRSTREKLMAYLLLQAKKAGSNRFDIPFDRQELADYLQVERSGLSAEIGKLRREGVLKSQKNRFELC